MSSTATLFADAIVGVGFPTIDLAIEAQRQGLAMFEGNQHNQSWRWLRKRLEGLPQKDLAELYARLKELEFEHAR